MYTTLFPDNECAQEIIEVGIAEVVYLSDKYHDEDYTTASRMLLDSAGVKYRWIQISSTENTIGLV